MLKCLSLVLLYLVTCPALFAAGTADAEVKDIVQKFQEALVRHDAEEIGKLVSSDIVVFENGHRNDGWTDFRDNHLIPEFKEPATPSKWEFVKVVVASEMAWAYTKQTIDVTRKDKNHAAYVWSGRSMSFRRPVRIGKTQRSTDALPTNRDSTCDTAPKIRAAIGRDRPCCVSNASNASTIEQIEYDNGHLTGTAAGSLVRGLGNN